MKMKALSLKKYLFGCNELSNKKALALAIHLNQWLSFLENGFLKQSDFNELIKEYTNQINWTFKDIDSLIIELSNILDIPIVDIEEVNNEQALFFSQFYKY